MDEVKILRELSEMTKYCSEHDGWCDDCEMIKRCNEFSNSVLSAFFAKVADILEGKEK